MAKRLNQARCLVSSSNTVPFVLPTERDSNSLNLYSKTTYDARRKEYCNEEGCFRGAFPTYEIAADNPVNTKRREFSLSAFLRYPNEYQLLTSRPPQTENSLFSRRHTPKTRPRDLSPRNSIPNSLTLWLTDPSGLTAGCVRTPEGSGRKIVGVCICTTLF